MKQKIVRNYREAVSFVNHSGKTTQAAAYWRRKVAGKYEYSRFEKLPGETEGGLTTEDVGGFWWDAKKTIAEKINEMSK